MSAPLLRRAVACLTAAAVTCGAPGLPVARVLAQETGAAATAQTPTSAPTAVPTVAAPLASPALAAPSAANLNAPGLTAASAASVRLAAPAAAPASAAAAAALGAPAAAAAGLAPSAAALAAPASEEPAALPAAAAAPASAAANEAPEHAAARAQAPGAVPQLHAAASASAEHAAVVFDGGRAAATAEAAAGVEASVASGLKPAAAPGERPAAAPGAAAAASASATPSLLVRPVLAFAKSLGVSDTPALRGVLESIAAPAATVLSWVSDHPNNTVRSLRQAYPKNHGALEAAIAQEIPELANAGLEGVEVNGDSLRVELAHGQARTVPFDASRLVERQQGYHKALLAHPDRYAILLLSGWEHGGLTDALRDRLLGMLQPYYKISAGKREENVDPLVYGGENLTAFLKSVLAIPNLGSAHKAAAEALALIKGGRYTDVDPLIESLSTLKVRIGKDFAAAGLNPAVFLTQLDYWIQQFEQERRSAQPVMIVPRNSHAEILRRLGLADRERLLDILTAPAPRRLLERSRRISAAQLKTYTLDQFLTLADDLKEYEFVNIFFLDKSGTPRPGSMRAAMSEAGIRIPVLKTADDGAEAIRMLNYLGPVNSFLFSRELSRDLSLDWRGVSTHSLLPASTAVGFFPSFAGRDAYRDAGSSLYETGNPDIQRIYQEAAEALDLKTNGQPDPTKLFFLEQNIPDDPARKQAFLAAAFTVHNLALNARLLSAAADTGAGLHMMAYTGESLGMLSAAVASGALSVGDAVRIASFFAPAVLAESERAEGRTFQALSLSGPDLDRVLAEAREALPDSFEVHRVASRQQVNIYVPEAALSDFEVFLSLNFPNVQVGRLTAPQPFIAHSSKIRGARESLDAFLRAQGVRFGAPRVPLISNSGAGMLTDGEDVRKAVLALVDQPMDSKETARTAEDLMPDMIVELGLGGRTRALLEANHVKTPFVEFTNQTGACDALCGTMKAANDLSAGLATLRSHEGPLTPAQYDLMRALFKRMAADPFSARFLTNEMRRILDHELLNDERHASPAFYRWLEVFQYTHEFRDFVDLKNGELVVGAVHKKRILGTENGKIDAEIAVLDKTGAVERRVLPDYRYPETFVYELGQMTASFPELAGKARELIETQPIARKIYEDLRRDLQLDGLGFFVEPTPADVPRLITSMIAYQYAMLRLMQVYRPALFAQTQTQLAVADETGWLVALAASGALSLPDVIRLRQAMAAASRSGAVAIEEGLKPFLERLGHAATPILGAGRRTLSSPAEIGSALTAFYKGRAINGSRPNPLTVTANSWVVTFDPGLRESLSVPKNRRVNFLHVGSPAEVWSHEANPTLDDIEDLSTMALTDANGRVLKYAQGKQMTSADVYAYVNAGEKIMGFGNGGSGSLTMYLEIPGRPGLQVRKVLSEALITANWDRKGEGVMMAPFKKARAQSTYIAGLPDSVKEFFPLVDPSGIQEREVTIPTDERKTGGLDSYMEHMYDMSFVEGETVSDVVREHHLPPPVVARLYEEIFRVLREKIHSQRRRVPVRPTLEPSYFQKIEARLALSRKTAPQVFSKDLLDSEKINIDGQEYLNIGPLLKKFREHPEYLDVLEPKFHSLVMGDTNTENIKVANLEPLLKAADAVKAGRTEGLDFTAEQLGIRFLDPRSIGFHEKGVDTGADDPMYDNKPWHNSLGHYDDLHAENFKLQVVAGGGVEPTINRYFAKDSPYAASYAGMESYFKPVMTQALGLDKPDSQYLKEDPYWLIRFAFLMGTHFTAMPPFHFTTELDGTMKDDVLHQRRPVAIYAEGIKWLNVALEMLEGRRKELYGVPVPALPYAAAPRAPPAASIVAPKAAPRAATAESRLLFSPWTRLARGTGLGQYPVAYESKVAGQIRSAFAALDEKVPSTHSYNRFSRLLTELILDVERPGPRITAEELTFRTEDILRALDGEKEPYQFVTASAILMESYAKLGLPVSLLVNERRDLVKESLDKVATIPFKNDGIYGYYEQVTGYTSLFLAVGQLGLQDRLTSGGQDYLAKALDQLATIPSPWNRGRGASMLFAALKVLGRENYLDGHGRDHIEETLAYIDRAEELNIWPTFPAAPLSHAYFTIEPYITMLNAIAALGRPDLIAKERTRIEKVHRMMAQLSPAETTLIGEYYLTMLRNLGQLGAAVPDLDAYLKDFAGIMNRVDAAPRWFPNGVAYPYAMETLWFFGREDLIDEGMKTRMIESLPAFVDAKDTANWGHPLSYILNTMGQLGETDRIFSPSAAYEGQSPLLWGIRHFAGDKTGLSKSLPLFDHALINLALRMRGADKGETPLYRGVRFAGDAAPLLPRLDQESSVFLNGWNRMSRGFGAGMFPAAHDADMDRGLREALELLKVHAPASDAYNRFTGLLTELVLDSRNLRPKELSARTAAVVAALRAIPGPLLRVNASALLFESFGKLGLGPALLVDGQHDLVAESLSWVDQIRPEENTSSGAAKAKTRGDYDQTISYAQLFVAIGHLGLKRRLQEPHGRAGSHVEAALATIEEIPSPFARGRHASQLFSALKVAGYDDAIFHNKAGKDYLAELLDYMDDESKKAIDANLTTTPNYRRAYPLMLTLGTIGVLGRKEYLTYKKDRIAEARAALSALSEDAGDDVAKHVALYLVALSNLGRGADQVPDLDGFLKGYLPEIFSRNDKNRAYALELLALAGREDLIPPQAIADWIKLLDISGTPELTRMAPYTAAMMLTVLGQLGHDKAKELFKPHPDFGGEAPFLKFLKDFAARTSAAAQYLPMLNHSILNYALRMREAPPAAPRPARAEILSSLRRGKLLAGMHSEELIGKDGAEITRMARRYQEAGVVPEIGASPAGLQALRVYRALNPGALVAAGEIGEHDAAQAVEAVRAGANVLVALENPLSAEVVRAVREIDPSVVIIAAASDEAEAESSIAAGVDGIKIRPFALDPQKVAQNVALTKTLRARHPGLLIGGSRGIKPEQLGSLFDAGVEFVGLGVSTALAGAQARDARPGKK